MKKIFSFLIAAFLISNVAVAQDTLFQDNFENGVVDEFVAETDTTGFWTTWSNNPGSNEDAVFSDAQNHTVGGSLSAHTIGVTTDLVLNFGNKISGIYAVEFFYYMPANKGGYFNIQHTENMGEEWAFECYFGNNGTGRLDADGSQISFNHANENWVKIYFIADLDDDSAFLYIDDALIHDWIFSHQSDGTAGIKQLGAADFYAGALTGQSPEFYIDDVKYIELEAGSNPPTASIDISTIDVTNPDTTVMFNVSNGGDLEMMFDVFAYYPLPAKRNVNNNTTSQTNNFVKLSSQSTQQTYIPVNLNPKDVNITHISGNMSNSLGWNTQTDVEVAALFKSDVMVNYVGMELSSIIIFNGDLPTSNSTSAKAWTGRRYTTPGPMELVQSTDFTPAAADGQTLVTLTEPVYITGEDLFIGWGFNDPGDGSFCAAMDDGPPVDDGNWTHYGPSWSEVTDPSYGNFGIVGMLTGTASTPWITLSNNSGTIEGGASAEVEVGFDVTDLAGDSTYYANLVVRSNDFDDNNNYIEIPVSLTYTIAGIDRQSNIAVMTYPNPAYDFLNIQSNELINSVQIYSINGQVIKGVNVNSNNTRIDISNLQQGVYIVNINTENGTSTTKLIIE
ncbi:MAG: T9SS type A sorting domain-containing protein [Bacteroidales bacterium]|nr:T9SS type A sorting domain-containing protein [Bacteroidales bacterium]